MPHRSDDPPDEPIGPCEICGGDPEQGISPHDLYDVFFLMRRLSQTIVAMPCGSGISLQDSHELYRQARDFIRRYPSGGCICPECHVCRCQGDPGCYPGHGLYANPDQIEQRQRREQEETEKAEEAEAEAQWLAELYKVDQWNALTDKQKEEEIKRRSEHE